MKFAGWALRAAALSGLAIGGNAMAQDQAQQPLNSIVQTDASHQLGAEDAETKLTEFVSYTCSHCASFEKQSEGALKLIFVRSGKVSVEIRHIIRDPVDLTAAMLAWCGPKEKFFQNHTAIMLAQPKWLATANGTTQAQQQRWFTGEYSSRRRAIASDLDFYGLMEGRGYGRTEVDACLNDDAKARKLVNESYENSRQFGVSGTPSFAINGKLLDGVHRWSSLQQVLQNATKSAE